MYSKVSVANASAFFMTQQSGNFGLILIEGNKNTVEKEEKVVEELIKKHNSCEPLRWAIN